MKIASLLRKHGPARGALAAEVFLIGLLLGCGSDDPPAARTASDRVEPGDAVAVAERDDDAGVSADDEDAVTEDQRSQTPAAADAGSRYSPLPGPEAGGDATAATSADPAPSQLTSPVEGNGSDPAATPRPEDTRPALPSPKSAVADREPGVPVNSLRGPAAADANAAAPERPAVEVPSSLRQPASSAPSGQAAADPDALFAGWPDPEFVLFITGRQHGYIEPCGCTGLTNQKGGMVRRFTFKRQLEQRGWTVVPVDVGNQVRRFGRQPEIKFQMTVEGMRRMDYRAIGFGPDDLRLSVGELVALTASDGQTPSPFVCANTAVIDPELTPRYQVIEAGGKKIGVTAILGKDAQAEISSDEIVKSDAVEALQGVWSELEQQECDVYVLLAHTTLEDSTALAQKFPRFDVVVTAGGAGEPTYEAEQIPDSDAVMVQVGTKGMYVGIIGVFDDADQPLRYQRVPLDARFPDAREMLQLLASYQDQLKTAGLQGLGIRAIPMPGKRRFVGSEACADCHDDEYDVWEDTPHSHALDSLIHPGERSEVPRHFDPECISCHVIGWNPQKYFPYESGYLSLEKTPLMQHVGCENCHGPGSQHVAAEQGDIDVTDEQMEQLQKEMWLPLEEAEKKCMECHDLDNSPDFHVEGAFDEYWEQIAH